MPKQYKILMQWVCMSPQTDMFGFFSKSHKYRENVFCSGSRWRKGAPPAPLVTQGSCLPPSLSTSLLVPFPYEVVSRVGDAWWRCGASA